ncbi:MAG: M23 family metallopeptidase [Gammaproteobacteria bacterium]|nr:M23 family metallopeptidase [Gammaproteobacteria bacterium]
MRATVALLLCAPFCAAAEPPRLGFPAACTPGKDCWIVNYVDDDPAPDSARDFRCGAQTYEGHDGTDIAIRDWKALEAGVDVLAAADGTVARMRDGMQDRQLSRDELQRLMKENRACGNGVFVDHAGGWRTIYCHMRRASIVVKPGDTVQAGQKLGVVGHSGYVEFPHVHLGVVHEKRKIDPFTGKGSEDGCGDAGASLWRQGLVPDYEPFSIYAAGFRDREPDFDDIKRDASSPASLPRTLAVLTFWVGIYGVAKGDRIELQIRDPDGGIFTERNITQERTRARQFYFVGKRTHEAARPGRYTGTVRVTRSQASSEPIKRELVQQIELN